MDQRHRCLMGSRQYKRCQRARTVDLVMSHTSDSGPKDEEDVVLQSRSREILDKVSLDRSSKRAVEYMAVSPAIGAEGPVGVLRG